MIVERTFELDQKHATVMVCGSGEMLQLGIDTETMEARRPQPIPKLQDVHVVAVCVIK